MSLERLEVTPACWVIGQIIADRGTGRLTIIVRDLRRDFYWSRGDLVLATSSSPAESLSSFLVQAGTIPPDSAARLASDDPCDVALQFLESDLVPHHRRLTLLREWTMSLLRPVFSLDEGTAAFAEDSALEPERRVLLPSPTVIVLEGIRSISNGLTLRRAVGDPSRVIRLTREPRFSLVETPLHPDEARVASSLQEPKTIQEFLKSFPGESLLAARTLIAMLTLGIFEVVDLERDLLTMHDTSQTERDLSIMAAIGPTDERSLRALAYARQAERLDYYKLFDVPRGATRALIVGNYERLRRQFEPLTYPPALRETLQDLVKLLDKAHDILAHPARRSDYDKMIADGRSSDPRAVHRMLVRKGIADENFAKARDLAIACDYYGAIVLLKQTVHYSPEHAEAWFLLGNCQQRNPKWQRDAMESYQRALAANPNHTEALLSLGDLYRASGLVSRARSCYEDVLAIDAENGEAAARLKTLK